jgi:hypothetical protein
MERVYCYTFAGDGWMEFGYTHTMLSRLAVTLLAGCDNTILADDAMFSLIQVPSKQEKEEVTHFSLKRWSIFNVPVF